MTGSSPSIARAGMLTACLAMLLTGLLAPRALAARPAAAAPCVTTLPVRVSTSSPYAAAYKHTLTIHVTTLGPKIGRLYVALYTFAGNLLGKGALERTVTGTSAVKIRLLYGLQAGSYTLYLYGYPNASTSCGPKHTSLVVSFLPCLTTLPVTLPDPPAGAAASYTSSLPVQLSTVRYLISDLNVSLSSFAGSVFGQAPLTALFGTVTVDIPLTQPLVSGSYTVYVTGQVNSEPTSCGSASASATLTLQ